MKNTTNISIAMSKPFWVVWGVEFWERFGFYGIQAIIALFFLKYLGFTQQHSMFLYGAFIAFVYGFIWVGGYLGDNYLGAKRCIFIGAFILMLGYISLIVASSTTIYYSLGAIIVGNAIFKANPSSLISKLYAKGDPKLDSAMTLYYMAINIGAFVSMALTPIIAVVVGWHAAFLVCAIGLFCGILSFMTFYSLASTVATTADTKSFDIRKIILTLTTALLSIFILGQLLHYISICYAIVGIVTFSGFVWFIIQALKLKDRDRTRMLVAFILILQGIMFFVLYNQIPTSLTFFAAHNVNNIIMNIHIPPAEYQALNPFFILLMSPILAILYQRVPATHATKFCIGMTFCAIAFLVLWLPQFTATNGLASPLWLVVSYFFQSTGELLISGLGLAMVAELCPASMSGFVMGIWFLTMMLAGPIAAWVGSLTVPPPSAVTDLQANLVNYSNVFAKVGLFTAAVALLMWAMRPFINRVI